MISEQQVLQMIRREISQQQGRDSLSVAQVGLHTHNGTDSLLVDFSDISNKYLLLPYTLFGTQAATAGNYSAFFTAPFAMTLMGVTEVHAVKGTDLSAVTLQIEKLTGTTAPGSGIAMLNAGFNLKGVINTVQTAVLSNTLGVVQMAPGDRLGLQLTGTPTSVANVTVTLKLSF